MSKETWKERFERLEAFTDQWAERAKTAERDAEALKDCLTAMAETTGRGVLRVEFRISKEKHILAIATAATGQEKELARIIGGAYAGLMGAHMEPPVEVLCRDAEAPQGEGP